MASEHKHKGAARNDVEETEVGSSSDESVAQRKEQLDADVDAILDDIDDVLEENAAEFVSSFVQKGGE